MAPIPRAIGGKIRYQGAPERVAAAKNHIDPNRSPALGMLSDEGGCPVRMDVIALDETRTARATLTLISWSPRRCLGTLRQVVGVDPMTDYTNPPGYRERSSPHGVHVLEHI